jgi:2-polyprenyl-6-methoxyphenol hydroxylase-like FAD-dependent oxidoreductase
MSEKSSEFVIVGGGVAGSALAHSLSTAGKSVVLLEQSTEFEDRVRGEWIAPWGVVEARELGILDTLRELGGHFLSRYVGYDELLQPEAAEAGAMDLSIWTDVPGPLTIQHVVMQQGLLDLAARSGAEIHRGVRRVEVQAGPEPRVSFDGSAGRSEVNCRMIIGADGRSSQVRRQLGIPLQEDPIDHLIGGLLIEGLKEWPEDQMAIGRVEDIMYIVFPQAEGRARLYVDYDAADRGRFSGPEGTKAFLACFDMAPVPGSHDIANAKPIGPCRSYPSRDSWTECPVVEGAVLVGDSAGYNDPIIGQGISIAFRDVRSVRDVLLSEGDWKPESFEGYVKERKERMRRLRFTAQMATRLWVSSDSDGLAARRRAFGKLAEKPQMFPLVGAFAGPEHIPANVLAEGFAEELFG